jgi:hypothetical protein
VHNFAVAPLLNGHAILAHPGRLKHALAAAEEAMRLLSTALCSDTFRETSVFLVDYQLIMWVHRPRSLEPLAVNC